MGLIGATFEVVYTGGTGFLMPPSAFIQRPMRWLETISRNRANVSVAPNFAYDLCVERSTAEERASLDLSPWTFALSGAEPVRAATIARFADAFAAAGFREKAFRPVYGLAEATLLVSGETDRHAAPVVRHIDRMALRENRVTSVPSDHPSATSIVGCGPASDSQEIIIVDPVTSSRCAPDQVGEIWIAGPNVARGYWGKAAETEETFRARTSDADGGRYLRTGDLGFLAADGKLFVTGRLKDVVIIRGRNYHPTDIEFTVQETHSGLMNGRGAAFSVLPESGPEQLVVVQEVDRQRIADADAEEIIAAIRAAITADHQIRPHAVLLVDVLSIPTTSSGKIRRRACKQEFIDGRLEAFAQWRAPEVGHLQLVAAPTAEPLEQPGRSAKEIQAWFVEQLTADLGLTPTEIDITRPFAYYGLDSVRSMQMMMALETWIGCEISPTLAYTYPTIEMVADHLAADADDNTAPTAEEVKGPEVRLDAALSRANHQERQRLLTTYLCERVAAQIHIMPSHVDIDLPLISFGLDSLMAAELRAQIECEIGIVVPLAELLDGPNVAGLADWLATTLSESERHKSNGTAPTDHGEATADGAAEASDLDEARWSDLLAQVGDASDDDVDVLLREILKVGEANND
jgi:acyl carrier protein